MRTARLALAAVALAAAAGAADPGAVLTPGEAAGPWSALVGALGSKGPVRATFTERRFFPFRREPAVLEGVLRFSPDRGLSLQYTSPQPGVMIADAAGIVIRDAGGRPREIASGSREAGAIASLLPIMRFDLPALYPRFVIRARQAGGQWSFEFTPRQTGAGEALGTITVTGSGTDVRHLEFRRSESQRVEIEVGETRSGVPFAPGEISQYFR